MSEFNTMKCNNCDRLHQVKIFDPAGSAKFNFKCRCMNQISGTYSNNTWDVNNASLVNRGSEEAVYMHEPEIV